jgi:hypothetical protein
MENKPLFEIGYTCVDSAYKRNLFVIYTIKSVQLKGDEYYYECDCNWIQSKTRNIEFYSESTIKNCSVPYTKALELLYGH